ncbi:MAG: SMP-30/gluconolactonase/LRE family protein [Spirochaetes bacterium]|nr:SMP-30/gluconolactonase/LRE family protein [Spirochaetota bacterium]
MTPQIAVDHKSVVGECPIWHPFDKKLYWIDIPEGIIFRYDPETGNHEEFYSGEVIGGFTIQEDGSLLLFLERGAVKILKDGETSTVIDEIYEELDTRFNDVIADPEGRVFCGTIPAKDNKARLYRLDTDGSITKILDGIGLSNGMGFTPDRKQMYFTDSLGGKIYLFDYDLETGKIKNQRMFVTVPESEGVPDGMTVDKEGCIWSARWDGGCLIRYKPDGKEDLRIQFPAKKISSVTFGGKDYRDIYVTTAGGDKREEEGPDAGALFYLNLDIQGVPEFLSKIGH